ncbi:sterol-sensing domain of SREBP cleavage-activation-domain-containing protein, partial [Delphinella strobiligena]
MLWYLLYPVRGTTDPPRLNIEHPVRRAFYRHGLLTARHWLLAMLVSVAIAVILVYPTIFLSDFGRLPHHVWASHRPYEGSAHISPDLEMRQIWIHGNYMKALDKTVLKGAMALQSAILGPSSDLDHDANLYPHRVDWGWQSPLMYWNSSLDLLEEDQDILHTVNEQTCQPSFLDSTLRPLSVFAGKEFSGSKITAADALVISFFSRVNNSMGETWHQNLLRLADQASGTQYQISGSIEGSRLYEYRSQPLSFRQNSALAIAYGFIAVYVAVSLKRLKAFHSRFGLVVTALTQITTSVLASFTICGVLGINLAQIPQEAYPFVVLVIGLENIFRFINAVLAYPPEMMNTQRIANGLGDIGMASVASAAQNLLILWIMSMVVSPGVAAFCVFAAVALLFDYFFLFTFFLAVLSVDIRRLELQDSIRLSRGGRTRVKKRIPLPERHSWIDALIQGRVPFSTRMAGSVVTISFVLVLNWHITDHSNPSTSLGSFPGLFEKQGLPTTQFDGTPSVNQSRHPGLFLRTQDFENAIHFMNALKPGAVDFTAKIYDPLVIVLAGSNRTNIPLRRSWLSALRVVALRHFYPVAMAAVFVVAFVTVLMNFLLWDERAEGAELDTGNGDCPPLTVDTVHTYHHLDIIKIAGCRAGHVLTAGIDRSISIALYNYKTSAYGSITLADESAALIRWPVQKCLIDGPSEWMALI